MQQTVLHILSGSALVVGLRSHERHRSSLYSNVIGFMRELNMRPVPTGCTYLVCDFCHILQKHYVNDLDQMLFGFVWPQHIFFLIPNK